MGQDLTLPTHLLLRGDGLPGSGPHAANAPLTLAAQRFYHILHTAASAGEHEKVVQVTALSTLNFLSGVGGGRSHLGVFTHPQTAKREFRWYPAGGKAGVKGVRCGRLGVSGRPLRGL